MIRIANAIGQIFSFFIHVELRTEISAAVLTVNTFFPRVYMNSVCLIFWALPVVPNLRHRETHITLNLEDDLGTLNKLIRKVEQIFNNNVKNTERLIVWLLNKAVASVP